MPIPALAYDRKCPDGTETRWPDHVVLPFLVASHDAHTTGENRFYEAWSTLLHHLFEPPFYICPQAGAPYPYDNDTICQGNQTPLMNILLLWMPFL